MTKMKTFLTAFVVLALVAPISTVPAYANECKPSLLSYAAHRGMMAARLKARSNWPGKAKAHYGLAYSVLKLAKNKNIACKHVGNFWVCSFWAMPCKY